MNSTLALALQITAANGAAGALGSLKKMLVDLGRLGKEGSQHFDDMTNSLKRAGTAFAGAVYLADKLKPGVKAAADLQESMLEFQTTVARTSDHAGSLNDKLQKMRDTAREVSKIAPYSATEVVQVGTMLAKGGVKPDAIFGPRGAAFAVSELAISAKQDPAVVSEALSKLGEQYSWKPKEYSRGADWISRAETMTPGHFDEIAYVLREFGDQAHAMGVDFSDSTAMASLMAPLGLQAGTGINRYMIDSMGTTKHQREAMLKLGVARMHGGKFENLLLRNGHYVGLGEENRLVREKLGGIKDEGLRTRLARDIWGEEGMRVALRVATSNTTFDEQKHKMQEILSAEDKMNNRMQGFNFSAQAAAGTVSTALAQAFTPVLSKATAVSNKINDIADTSATWLSKHPTANNAVAYGLGGAVAGTALYGLWHLTKGGISGAKMLASLKTSAAGIATGKAVEAATGVTAVFVTNWPGSLGGPAEMPTVKDGLEETVKKAGGTGLLGRALKFGGRFSLAAAPLAAMYGASEWAGDTSHDQSRVSSLMGVREALTRFLGVFGYNHDKEIEERRRANREGLDMGPPQTINVQIDSRTVATAVNDYNARQGKRN